MKSQTLKETNVTFLDPLWSYKGRTYEGILKGVSIKFPQITSLLGKFLPFNSTAFSSFTEVLPVTWRAITTHPWRPKRTPKQSHWLIVFSSFHKGCRWSCSCHKSKPMPTPVCPEHPLSGGDPSLFFTHFIFSSLAAPAPSGQALWRTFSHK